jgi:signal transduction histidine kinase
VGFAAPNLRGSGTTRFRFRLDPLDKSWVNAGARRSAYYPAIPPGEYIFKVAAIGDRGDWSQNAATLAILVQPFLWQTWWFKVAAVTALTGAGCLWFFQRTAQLKARHAAQEEFTRQLMHSQENERKRVASELHDGLGQDLLLIKNRLKLLASNANHPPHVAQELAQISTHTTSAIAEVRAISHALRPSALEQVGFTRAVEWMVEQVAETTTTKIQTELQNVDGLLPPEMEIQMYRILQEGLNNVMKHAAASEVIVGIKRESPGITMSIFDNGTGFDVERLEQGNFKPSFGLTGMRERAKALGGIIEWQSVLGKGTRLTLNVPLSRNGH